MEVFCLLCYLYIYFLFNRSVNLFLLFQFLEYYSCLRGFWLSCFFKFYVLCNYYHHYRTIDVIPSLFSSPYLFNRIFVIIIAPVSVIIIDIKFYVRLWLIGLPSQLFDIILITLNICIKFKSFLLCYQSEVIIIIIITFIAVFIVVTDVVIDVAK